MLRNPFWVDRLLLVMLAALVMFWGLGKSRLWDQDEGYFASAGSEMYAKGDWIVPVFNGELFSHKPPMMYWGMMTGFSLFGVGEVGARFFSALCGVLTVLLTYELGRLFFDRVSSLIAAVVLLASVHFPLIMRAATPDSYLVFWTTLAMYLWARSWVRSNQDASAISAASWALIYLCLSMAILAKGPLFLILPLLAIGSFLVLAASDVASRTIGEHESPLRRTWNAAILRLAPSRIARVIWNMRPMTVLLVVGLIACPWFIVVGLRTDGEFLREFFLVHHLGRFSQAMDNHRGSIFYYVVSSLVGLYPWTGFVLPILWFWFQNRPIEPNAKKASSFLACWVIAYFLPFTLASTKLANYILPAYPPLALLIGAYFGSWTRFSNLIARRWQFVAFSLLAIVGFVWIGAFAQFEGVLGWLRLSQKLQWHPKFLSFATQLSWIGVPLVVAGIAGWLSIRHRRPRAAIGILASSGLCMTLILNQWLAPKLDSFQSPQTIATELKSRYAGQVGLAVYGPFRPSMVFYLGEPIRFLTSKEELIAELRAGRIERLLVEDQLFQSLELVDRERLTRVLAGIDYPESTELIAFETTDFRQRR